MQKQYNLISNSADLNELLNWARQVTRERGVDLDDYDDQRASDVVFFDGTPSSSSDLTGTEKAGDIAADTSFLYVVVDNAGTLQWQRVATATF